MISDIRTKLLELRRLVATDEDIGEVQKRERRLRSMVLQKSLKNHDAVIMIIEDAEKRIKAINTVLVEKEDIEEMERKLLMRERAVFRFFLSRFDPNYVENGIKELEEQLDKDIAYFKSE